ncbi:MAG: hypothetical protein QXT16_08730 [Candidatus Caldarchaeum sp.]
MKMKHVMYVVDWDIPAVPSTLRVRFWRGLKELGVKGRKSSQSVFFTPSRQLAQEIYGLALECGATKASLWRAQLMERAGERAPSGSKEKVEETAGGRAPSRSKGKAIPRAEERAPSESKGEA